MFMIEKFIEYCREGNIEAVKWCLLQDFNVNMKDKYGDTGFMWACDKNNKEIIELLLKDRRVKVNLKNKKQQTGFMYSNKEITELLLKDRRVNVNLKDKDGFTKFICACIHNNKEVVKLLLSDNRIDVNVKDKFGYTGFMYARINDKTNRLIQKYLLKNSIKDNVEFNIN